MRNDINLALTRWAVVCREWNAISAGSMPDLIAFLAGWGCCMIGAHQSEVEKFRDSFNVGWYQAELFKTEYINEINDNI